jgi:hypothetical protein
MKISGSEDTAPLFLTLGLDGGKWSASHPNHFISGEGPPEPTG